MAAAARALPLCLLAGLIAVVAGCDQNSRSGVSENALLEENQALRERIAVLERELETPEPADGYADPDPLLPPPSQTATAPSGTRSASVHVVRRGETLSGIARQYYGNSGRWHDIYAANRDRIGANPNRLMVGAELVIPGG